MRRKNMLRSLSLSLAALLLTTPVWAQENSAADVVENQTMTIGGKEQIVTKAALEKAQKAQKGKGKYKGGKKKLSDQQIQEIKAVVNNRKTNISLLAKHYGITRQTIYNLIK